MVKAYATFLQQPIYYHLSNKGKMPKQGARERKIPQEVTQTKLKITGILHQTGQIIKAEVI